MKKSIAKDYDINAYIIDHLTLLFRTEDTEYVYRDEKLMNCEDKIFSVL